MQSSFGTLRIWSSTPSSSGSLTGKEVSLIYDKELMYKENDVQDAQDILLGGKMKVAEKFMI